MKRRIIYLLVLLILTNQLFAQESFSLNSASSTPSNDGNFCGRVKFSVTNSNSFDIDVEIWQKAPGASIYSSTGFTTTVTANQTLNTLNSTYVSSSGLYSYYAVFTKTLDNSSLSNSSATPINVTINSLPIAGTPSGANAVCVGSTINLTPTPTGGSTTYSSFSWSSSFTSFGTIGSTSGDVTGVASGSTNITYTVTDNKGCISAVSSIYVLTINSRPSANITSVGSSICIGVNSATISGSVNAVGAWTLGLSDGSSIPGTGNSDWSKVVSPGLTTSYTISSLSDSKCTSFNTDFTGSKLVNVNPLPIVTFTASANTNECQSTNITYATQSGNSSYTWGLPGVQNTDYTITSGSTSTTSNTFTLKWLTTGSKSVQLNYYDANGCTANLNTLSTTNINPTPDVVINIPSQVKCNGINSDAISFTSSVSGATFSWTNDQTLIGIVGSGTGSISSTPLTNTISSPLVGSFNVTPSANSCLGPVGTFSITVNPTPTVDAITNQIKCNGVNSDAINFTSSVSGATFTWTNNLSSIGIATSGSGNISSTLLSNTSNTTNLATFNVTPTASSCPGPVSSFLITVNPTPTVDAVINQIKCNGINSDAINLTSSVSGATFTWINNLSSIGIAGSGIGNINSTPLSNSTNTVNIATFNVTPTANGCQGPATSFTITVNSSPNVTATSNPSDGLICAGSNITLNGGGANTYVWSGSVSNGIAFVPTTTTTYTVTGTDGNGCTNTATKTVTVKSLPNTPTSTPQIVVYDGNAHSGIANAGTGETIFWYSSATGNSTTLIPTQTIVGKNEAYAEAKLDVTPFCISANRSNVSIEITPAPLTIKNITGATKVYDGTTTASINGTAAYDGLVTADAGLATVQGGPSFNFDNKDAGVNKPITVTGYIAPSSNYVLTQPTGLTASITPAPITIAGITGVSRTYDRTINATVAGTPVYTGLVAGENLTVVGSPTYSFANKNVGTAKPITVSGFTAPDANYTLSAQPTGITADINPKLLTITGSIPDRMYDASKNTPGLNLSIDPILGDIVNISRTGALFDNANAGVNKDIFVTGLSINTGDDGANYYLASTTATVKGTIKPLQINIVAIDATKTELDPDPPFTYQPVSLLGTDVFTGSLSRFPGEAPADYPITIGSLSAGNNYLLNLNSAKLTIKPLVTNYIFEVPNAFTPNLDGTNDVLKIIKNYRVTGLNYFRIYNRTGQLVFETRALTEGWNGRRMGDMSGNILESDLYIWVAEFTNMNDAGPVKKSGTVLLLK